ncbi:MAG: winged helix-turn-helix domain-containing protein [Candidatus Omnitrophota bacterium]|nr:winged helix-turn-helix domain-containing protein [Candidatus Omnitrophota bacterium]
MKPSTYRDMHLLNEVTQSPDVTQRELSRRIGAALGLTNLMLRRLVQKGYIKISGTKRSRIRYLITPQGILEKSRLTYEFVQYSLQLFSRARFFLREQLTLVAKRGHRRILLCGTGELAEIAFLTIHEMGLELVGVVDEPPTAQRFLGHPVKDLDAVSPAAYDCLIVASKRWDGRMEQRLMALGVQEGGVILLSMPGTPGVMSSTPVAAEPVPSSPAPEPVAAGEGTTQ